VQVSISSLRNSEFVYSWKAGGQCSIHGAGQLESPGTPVDPESAAC